MKKKIYFLLCMPLLIGGCALFGSKYKKPDVDVPNNWNSNKLCESGVNESGQNISDISWWNRFNDPTLDQLITMALDNNNMLQQAIANIDVAQSSLQRVKMSWIPTINIGATAGLNHTFSSNTNFVNPAFSSMTQSINNSDNMNFYAAGLIPSYSLNILGQLKQTDIAKLNLASSVATKDSVRLTVISQVVGSYFTLLALDEQLERQTQLINDFEELVKLTNTQYKNGLIPLSDVQKYKQQLEQAKMSLPQIKNNIVTTSNALRILMGKNPGDIARDIKFANISTDGIIPISLPSEVLQNRPDIIQAEKQLELAHANIDEARSRFFPSISLTTPLGAFGADVPNLFKPNGSFWSGQITAMMPILNLGLLSLVKERKSQYYIAYYNYVQTVQTAFAQVDNAFSNYEQSKQARYMALALESTVNSSFELDQENYKLGYISYPQSLNSKLALDNTHLVLTQVKLQELQAIVNLYQAMAGGYNYQNNATIKKKIEK